MFPCDYSSRPVLTPALYNLLRLRKRLTPNGKLYIVGMEPIPDSAVPPADIICEVYTLRVLCILKFLLLLLSEL